MERDFLKTNRQSAKEIFDQWALDHHAEGMEKGHWKRVKKAFELIPPSQGNYLEIGIRQIAGLIARRIVCRAKQGDLVDQGNRFGLIRFGSRVDLLLPSSVEILVHPGQKVKAGLSSIARVRL